MASFGGPHQLPDEGGSIVLTPNQAADTDALCDGNEHRDRVEQKVRQFLCERTTLTVEVTPTLNTYSIQFDIKDIKYVTL